MSRLSFIHCADLHLDSPFTGMQQVDEEVAAHLLEASFLAFDNLIRTALDRKVDFLLVAGDVFDQDQRSFRAQVRFRDGLEHLARAGIPSYVVHGNHDPLDGWLASLRFPPEVTFFPGDRVDSRVFSRDGRDLARIHGISYPTRKVADDFGADFRRSGPEPLQIGLFHCNLGGDPGHDPYAPRTLEQLQASGLDYWALGHIHQARVLRTESPFVAYPGNLQGRHVRESGPRGALLVETHGSRVQRHERLVLDVVRWSCARVDISGLDSDEALLERLQETVEEASEEAAGRALVIRLELIGRGLLHSRLKRTRTDLLDLLRQRQPRGPVFIWIESLEDRTRPEVDLEDRSRAEDFAGSMLRLAGELRERPEELREWLGELWNHPQAARLLGELGPAELEDLFDRATWLAIDPFLEAE